MPDYSKGKIYKIVDLYTDECYIGSTCEPTLARRLAKHKNDYKLYKRGKSRFVTSYRIMENDNYDIQLIENYPCESKDELHAREGHWIKQTDCVNVRVAGRSHKESCKQYYEDNKEIIAEYHKQWYEDNKEKIKQHYLDNIDKIKEKNEKYRRLNKEKISLRKSEKMICDCGSEFRRDEKARHERAIKHHKYLESRGKQ